MEHYNWHILGLAEVRRPGVGEVTTDEGHKLWFSGDTKECRNGVGFFVHKHGWRNFFKVGGNKCTLKRNYSKFCGLNWQL